MRLESWFRAHSIEERIPFQMNLLKRRPGELIKAIFKLAGFDIFIQKSGYHYVPDYFGHAFYKQDFLPQMSVFGEVAQQVIHEEKSSLYYDRLYMIFQAMIYLKSCTSLSQRINFVEIGVYRGGTSYFIASIAQKIKLAVSHHCFDTFEGHASQDIDSTIDTSHLPSMFNDTSYEAVQKYLNSFENIMIFKGRFQDTCQNIESKEIHFAHLDVDIYDPTIFGLNFIHKRLVPGGVVIVDDYGFTTCPGVKKAVDEFLYATPGYFAMPFLTGQYLFVKLGE
jgi:hypothetical protein